MDVLMEPSPEKDAAAGAALEALMDASRPAEPSRQETEAEVPDPATAEAAPEEQAAETETADDDIASLRSRLAEREAAATRYEEQLKAVRERGQQSLDSVRQQMLRKSSVLDRARQVIEKAMSADGVDKTEADRLLSEIRGSYNPASPNYAPPQPEPVYDQPQQSLDERALAVNEWLNDNGLTQDEATAFGDYLRNPANLTDRERKMSDIYSFLTVVAPRWREAHTAAAAKQKDNVRAVQTVARVQKQAAKVAAQSIGAPSTKTVGKSAQPQPGKLTDEQLEGLLHQIVGR